jgi:hypothetical protein
MKYKAFFAHRTIRQVDGQEQLLSSSTSMEDQINAWLDETKPSEIVNVSTSQHLEKQQDGELAAMLRISIFYEPGRETKASSPT